MIGYRGAVSVYEQAPNCQPKAGIHVVYPKPPGGIAAV